MNTPLNIHKMPDKKLALSTILVHISDWVLHQNLTEGENIVIKEHGIHLEIHIKALDPDDFWLDPSGKEIIQVPEPPDEAR